MRVCYQKQAFGVMHVATKTLISINPEMQISIPLAEQNISEQLSIEVLIKLVSIYMVGWKDWMIPV